MANMYISLIYEFFFPKKKLIYEFLYLCYFYIIPYRATNYNIIFT